MTERPSNVVPRPTQALGLMPARACNPGSVPAHRSNSLRRKYGGARGSARRFALAACLGTQDDRGEQHHGSHQARAAVGRHCTQQNRIHRRARNTALRATRRHIVPVPSAQQPRGTGSRVATALQAPARMAALRVALQLRRVLSVLPLLAMSRFSAICEAIHQRAPWWSISADRGTAKRMVLG